VFRMLAKTPEERFGSVPEALSALGATPLSPDDKLHAELERLAAASDRLGQLADVIRTPASPVPKTRERPKATLTPASSVAAAPATVTPAAAPAIAAAPQPTRVSPAPTPVPSAATKSGGVIRWVIPAVLATGAVVYLAMRPRTASAPARETSATQPAAPPPTVSPSGTPNDSTSTVTASNAAASNTTAPNVVPPPTTPVVVDSAAASKTASSSTKPPRGDTAALARSTTTSRQAQTNPPKPTPKVETPSRAQKNPPASNDVAAEPPRSQTTPDPAPAPPPIKPAPTETPKTEAEHRAEIQGVIGSYVRAIEQRDTSLIRRVFPAAGSELMSRWQTTFADARGPIAMSNGTIDIVDTPRDAAGSQVQARAKYVARFSSKAARSDQSFPVTFTAVLQRDGGTWHITNIR